MNTTRQCGCKSFRTCAICELEFGFKHTEDKTDEDTDIFNFCPDTQTCILKTPGGDVVSKQWTGLIILKDFITEEEENQLVKDLDDIPWTSSQSGRRKQNFGPKANFKKRKTKVGSFAGFPTTTRFIQDRFNTLSCLEDYRVVEQCSIEYRPETGASIEPHIDDCWIWGERIVQLNLLSDTVLTFTPYHGDTSRYNLEDVSTYPRVMDEDGTVRYNPFSEKGDIGDKPYQLKQSSFPKNCVVRAVLPARSLLVMYGEPRYEWEHSISRADIRERRICVAYRELTPTYLPGGREEGMGRLVLEQAAKFW